MKLLFFVILNICYSMQKKMSINKIMKVDSDTIKSVFEIVFKVLENEKDQKEIDKYIVDVMSLLKDAISVLSVKSMQNNIILLASYKESEKLFSFFKFLWTEMIKKQNTGKYLDQMFVEDLIEEVDIKNTSIIEFLFKDKLFRNIAATIKGVKMFNVFSYLSFSNIEFLLDKTSFTLIYENETLNGVTKSIKFEKINNEEEGVWYAAELDVLIGINQSTVYHFSNSSFESLLVEILQEVSISQNDWVSWYIPRKTIR